MYTVVKMFVFVRFLHLVCLATC